LTPLATLMLCPPLENFMHMPLVVARVGKAGSA